MAELRVRPTLLAVDGVYTTNKRCEVLLQKVIRCSKLLEKLKDPVRLEECENELNQLKEALRRTKRLIHEWKDQGQDACRSLMRLVLQKSSHEKFLMCKELLVEAKAVSRGHRKAQHRTGQHNIQTPEQHLFVACACSLCTHAVVYTMDHTSDAIYSHMFRTHKQSIDAVYTRIWSALVAYNEARNEGAHTESLHFCMKALSAVSARHITNCTSIVLHRRTLCDVYALLCSHLCRI